MRKLLNSKIPAAGVLALAAAVIAAACGGSSGSSTGNPVVPATNVVPGSIGATITLGATGASPIDVRIEPTQRVRFVNADTRPHQLQTNPHNFHTDCPPNNITMLNPGQSVDSATFHDVKACGYHDHLLPDEQKYWGTIRVGVETKGPIYSKGG